MANTRYGTNTQNTSQYVTDLINEFNKMPRDVFDESRRKVFDANIYDIIPVECFEMLPNSEVHLKYDVQMLTKNPTIKRLLSGMSVEFRVYKAKYSDLWEGWNNFITKGRTGKVNLKVPSVDFSLGSDSFTTSLPYSPAYYLNFAPCVFCAKDDDGAKFRYTPNSGVKNVSDLQSSGLTGISTLAALKSSVSMKISALPLVMYNKIAREFMNSNLMQDNTNWFPENDDHENYLPYDCDEVVTTSCFDEPTKKFDDNSKVNPSADEESYPWLNVLWKSQRKGDYFNTGSPFPDLIRGDVPTLDVISAQLNNPEVSLDFRDSVLNSGSTSVSSKDILALHSSSSLIFDGVHSSSSDTVTSAGPHSSLVGALNKAHGTLSDSTVKGIQFSMQQWRYLATMTVFRERMALTDGSYNQMIKAMFGHNPNYHTHQAVYCGGFKQPIVFSEVVNTTAGDSAPLGDSAGRGYSSDGSGVIKVKSDDYGLFMTVMVISADEYYSQGVDKMFSRLTNSEQYFPILNNLSPDSITNDELYVSGNNTKDKQVFNYQERFAYYKSRRNQVSGLMALPISKIGDIGAYIQNRLFGETPNFNSEFAYGILTENEKNIFASTDEAQFCAVVGSSMRYIGPIPRDSRPSDMGISY